MHIGIDLDNTIIDYDGAFRAVARELGLLPEGFAGGRTALRAALRALPQGEIRWQEVQARVYGPEIGRARPMPGVADFLAACRAASVPVTVISHKTRTAAQAPDGPDLHAAARGWLARAGLLGGPHGVPADRLFFETDRAGKLARIAAEGCTHFIDDLPELLEDPRFPPRVERLLFAPAGPPAGTRLAAFAGWPALAAALLPGGRAVERF